MNEEGVRRKVLSNGDDNDSNHK